MCLQMSEYAASFETSALFRMVGAESQPMSWQRRFRNIWLAPLVNSVQLETLKPFHLLPAVRREWLSPRLVP